ncbi:MAG: MBOAT family protein [Deltaproteobacteria bacterium]|nr:MBOAT family protein [Deltaproteobacteria bacterium]MBW2420857.1 MBOAT family protein [Deltaproteobacteria bacterium]
MLFSSTVFLFAFLPLVLTAYFLLRDTRARNLLLLIASLVFYAWGETVYVAVLLFTIAINHLFGLWIEGARGAAGARLALAAAVALNLAVLGVFKYANFLVENLDPLTRSLGFAPIELAPIHLPIGVSFFVFQSITYVVDVYRRDAPVQRNPLQVALYIALFPQLIAGPIVRYREVADQLRERVSRLDDVAWGVRRFIIGLGKKVLIANTLALPADSIFALGPAQLQTPVAWLGVLCYALQIYFDFSGYSDMAIGLGRIFGFRFPENFRHPYVASSVREFWRRWHISLATFFRDYLYIPMGGGRGTPLRTYRNLVTVFLLCGLWHGASWNFVVWGMIHGGCMVFERAGGERLLARAPALLGRIYLWLVVLGAWVFFRAESMPAALSYLRAMLGMGSAAGAAHPLALYLDRELVLVLLLGLLGATPWIAHLKRRLAGRGEWSRALELGYGWGRFAFLNGVLLGSAMSLAAGTHNPFIYFRF